MRSVLAVLGGYLVFGVSAALLFQLSGADPHRKPELSFLIGSTIYGIVFAFLAGYTAARIAGKNEVKHAIGVACILAVLAAISLLAQPGLPSHWSQIAAIVLMAPAAVVGGWLRARQGKVTQ